VSASWDRVRDSLSEDDVQEALALYDMLVEDGYSHSQALEEVELAWL